MIVDWPETKVAHTIVQLHRLRGFGLIASSHPIPLGAFRKGSSEKKRDMI